MQRRALPLMGRSYERGVPLKVPAESVAKVRYPGLKLVEET